MTTTNPTHQAGEYMATEYLARRPLDIMTQPFAPTDEAGAYAIQEAFLNRVADAGDTTVWGYKIAYTNNVMRERAGIYEPVSGLILASGVHESGATLDSADYYRLGIECEVAVRIGADLPASGAPYTRESVSDAIEWLAASFELVDGREGAVVEGVDPSLRAIVVNISNGGAVLGERVRDWQGLDLVASSGRMLVNGEVVGQGVGADVLGHPVEPVAWLANSLVARGKNLAAGDTILTGSYAPPYLLNAGDAAVAEIEGLGEAQFTVA